MRSLDRLVKFWIPVGCLALTACAHAQRSPSTTDFGGSWSVKWCDRTASDADCGGFVITLAQDGDLLKGEASGARVRLAQIDEAVTVHGIVIGSTAVMTVESGRSGAIYLVQASVDGDCMSWKVRDTVQAAQRDVDIIANDDVLRREGVGTPCRR